MAGETPDDPRSGQPDEFLSKTKWQRFQVLIMGPVMNILLAIVLMWVVLMQGDREFSFLQRPVKVGAVAAGSPAERGGRSAGGRHRHGGRAQGRHLGAVLDGHRNEGQAGGEDRGRPRRSDRAADRDAGCADEVRDRRHRRLPGRAPVDRGGRGRRGGRAGRAEVGRRRPRLQRPDDHLPAAVDGRHREAPEPGGGLRRAAGERAEGHLGDHDAAGQEGPRRRQSGRRRRSSCSAGRGRLRS